MTVTHPKYGPGMWSPKSRDALYTPHEKACEWCGESFTARHPKARCCSQKCTSRKWVAEHPEEAKAQQRRYRERHREVIRARDRALKAADPDHVAKVRAWQIANPERNAASQRDHARRRRARKVATQVELFTLDQVLERDGMVCGICREEIADRSDLHLDHVLPLSRGGTHTLDNVQPSHARCNMKKGARVA